jgi:Bacterial Ig domain
MTRRVLASVLLLLAAPASAHAATLTSSGGTLTYTGEAGEANDVTFTQGALSVTVMAADVTTATGCTGTGPAYTCTGVGTVIADGKDGDDSLDASGLTTARATLTGGDGDDSLRGGDAADTIGGGDGIDTYTAAGDPVSVSLNDVADDGTTGEGDNVRSDVEDVSAGGATTVTLAGSASGNVLTVTGGDGTISGGPGFDALRGGPGKDAIDARDGYADRVSCAADTDSVKADQLDQVASDCETVTREPFVGGADDRPPVVAWTAPEAGVSISADKPATLTAEASDDRGVAKVQFLDDDRLVCEDAVAPYTCEYQARGGDVGRDTLIARAVDTADQASSAIQAVTVRRFSARRLTLKLNPGRDTRAPYRFQVTGNLTLPPTVARTQGCQGSEVAIIVRAGSKIVASRRLTLSRVCGYQRRISFTRRPPGTRLRFAAKFLGNDVMQPISSPTRTGRTG